MSIIEIQKVVFAGFILPAVVLCSTLIFGQFWNNLPEVLPSHWSSFNDNELAPTAQTLRDTVILSVFAFAASGAVAIASIVERHWTRFWRLAITIMAGVSVASSFYYLALRIVAHNHSSVQLADIGFSPYLAFIFAGFSVGVVLSYRLTSSND